MVGEGIDPALEGASYNTPLLVFIRRRSRHRVDVCTRPAPLSQVPCTPTPLASPYMLMAALARKMFLRRGYRSYAVGIPCSPSNVPLTAGTRALAWQGAGRGAQHTAAAALGLVASTPPRAFPPSWVLKITPGDPRRSRMCGFKCQWHCTWDRAGVRATRTDSCARA